jgi:hypothetical protein
VEPSDAPWKVERMTPARPALSARGTRLRAASYRVPAAWFAVGVAAAAVGLFGTVAADSRWLAALGGYVARHGVPDFVPFASAPSDGWPNVPVLAELAFHALDAAGGDRAFLAAQVAAVTAAFALLAAGLRRAGASGPAGLVVLLALVPGAFASLAAIRSQLFSLVLFPALVLLVRAEAARPSRRVWWLVPLLALWSNLHGAALVGLAVAAAYLLLERARREPVVAAGALAASALALFATPALWRTGEYYAGVLGNEAARRGVGLWAPLSLGSGLDLALLVCAVLLAAAALRSRPRLWELVALAGLAALTVQTARGGVWFLFFAATPAALGLGIGREGDARARLALPGAVAMLALAVVGVVRGPHEASAHRALVERAVAEAGGTPVLATDQLAEQVALAGGRIWIGNPIDAFRRRDQRLYVDWLQARPAGDAALAHAPRVVLVAVGSDAQKRLARRGVLREVARDSGGVLYVRR